eukprot:4347584-Ditylum_brightwellii.AAC.1
MHAKQADLYRWAKINVPWTELWKNQMEYHGHHIHDNYKLIATLSSEPAEYKQPSGACLALVDKIVGRHMHSNADDKVGYQHCKQNKPGDTTINAQKKCLLTMQGEHDPKPRKVWDNNMLSLIWKWKKEGAEVTLM